MRAEHVVRCAGRLRDALRPNVALLLSGAAVHSGSRPSASSSYYQRHAGGQIARSRAWALDAPQPLTDVPCCCGRGGERIANETARAGRRRAGQHSSR